MTLLDQLRRDEGLRLTPYRDSVGALTIGYGRNLDAKGISRGEAEVMLEHDAAGAAAEVDGALPWSGSLDDARRAVLVNMAFNMGLGVHGQSGLLGFTRTLAAVEAGDYDRAAAEMMDSKWARQVGPRAHRLARQMQTGEWQ